MMAYKQRKDGKFRLRASFDIPPEVSVGLNAIAARSGLSVASLCLIAVKQLIADTRIDSDAAAPSLSVTAGGEA
jgi:hypothetical protein